MAETYLCVRREPGEPGDARSRKTTIEDRACCKRLLPHHDERPEFRADLEREAAIVACLRHSNIAQLRGWHLAERELYFELVEGANLYVVVADLPGHQLAPPFVTLIGIELCKALRYAHSRTREGKPAGIIHRDISPSNVMISYEGEVKLTDFGLAAVVALEQRAGEPLSGIVRGKLPYMSPEQARGDRYADHRADLYSLGVLLYELLAGYRPFDSAGDDDDSIFERIDGGRYKPLLEALPTVPKELADIVERLFRRNPAQRFRNADEVLDALAALAPPHNLFRELGELAKRAKPPETLDYKAFRDADDNAPVLEPAGDAGFAHLQQPARRGPSGRVLSGATVILVALVAALLLLAPKPSVGAKQEPLSSSAREQVPVAVAAVQPVLAAEVPRLTADVDAANAVETASRSASDSVPSADTKKDLEESAAAKKPSPQANPGTLQVGVVPFARVWVDGKYLGWSWSPITVKLDPDVEHTVAAGEHKAEISQPVRLGPGERRSITLRLPK